MPAFFESMCITGRWEQEFIPVGESPYSVISVSGDMQV